MRPNIIFFFTDDQRFDTIHALGNDQIITPNLDELVNRGCVFENGYIMGGTCGAVCMPSRAMIHTGKTLFHLQDSGRAVPQEHALLGETFRQAGYQTFGAGKWHNGKQAYARSFTDGGEIYFGGMADHWNVPAHDFDHKGEYKGRIPRCKDPHYSNELEYTNADHIKAGVHSTDLISSAALEYLDRREEGTPFFMYLSFLAPHDPRTMPEEFLNMYDPDGIELPGNFMPEHPFDNGEMSVRDEKLEAFPRTEEAIRKHTAEYYAMITHVDARIGGIIGKLKEQGEYENTVIVFAGDNGLAVGRHGLMGKQSVYDHSVHVPLIFAGPGVPAGEKRSAFAYLLDIFPTLCGLTGTEIPATVEGKSLVPAMEHPDEQIRETLYYAYTSLHRGIRESQYKLIEYNVSGNRTTQLFDLVNDPWEIENLSTSPEHAETLERLRKELFRWRDETDDTLPEYGGKFWEGF